MSVSMTIRDVPTEVRDELAARAARSGRSLQEYVRATLVEIASRPSAADVVTLVRDRARAYPPAPFGDVLDDLRADRR